MPCKILQTHDKFSSLDEGIDDSCFDSTIKETTIVLFPEIGPCLLFNKRNLVYRRKQQLRESIFNASILLHGFIKQTSESWKLFKEFLNTDSQGFLSV